jgi:adenosylhomocysteine nucleosidase
MESDIVGSVAAELEKPLIVIRAIADAADAAVPAWALAAVGPDGRSRPSVVVGQLLRRPNEIGALVRLAGDFRRALKSLRVAAAAIEAVHTRRIAADDEEA